MAKPGRYLVVVQSPDCFRSNERVFLIHERLLLGWLKAARAAMPQHDFALKVGSVVSLATVVYLPLALQRITSTEADRFCDQLWGDSDGNGLVELAKFIRGGRFRVVDGHTTTPEELV